MPEPVGWELSTPLRPRNWHVTRANNVLDHPFPRGKRCFVVVDSNVASRYRDALEAMFPLEAGGLTLVIWETSEHAKSLASVGSIAERMFKAGIGRSDAVIGIGGGIIMDLVGLTASLYLKGIDYVLVPTTLLAMVDAAPALKRAVNVGRKKNGVGEYRPPEDVYIDTRFLATLPKRELCNGLAEIAKVGQVADGELWKLLTEHGPRLVDSQFDHEAANEVLDRATDAMIEHHRANPYEQEVARWPDHGHNVGPVLEMLDPGAILHGECVAICCAYSAALGKILRPNESDKLSEVVTFNENVGLPTWHDALADEDFLKEVASGIRKVRKGSLNWPLIGGDFGSVQFAEPTHEEMMAATRLLKECV